MSTTQERTEVRDGWEIRYGEPNLAVQIGPPVNGDYDQDGRVFDGRGWVEHRQQLPAWRHDTWAVADEDDQHLDDPPYVDDLADEATDDVTVLEDVR